MKNSLTILVLLLAVAATAATSRTAPPTTTNNDDSCDLAVQPAATLLLPYFEVDLQNAATTTLVTIQNVSPSPQTANVTLWTDWGYPAVNFPIRLSGYDVQGFSLYDVFTSGALPSSACAAAPSLSAGLAADLRFMFTTGKGAANAISCTAKVGGVHAHAIGYVTVDLVASCAATNATSPGYFTNLLYDNVLTGDAQQIVTSSDGNKYAFSSPLVHIRAIPEGGAPGTVAATALPYTFYDHFTPSAALRTSDRRQPLPSTFSARFIERGTNAFNSTLKIWREGITIGACSGAGVAAASNSSMDIAEVVRFDEHENATIMPALTGISAAPPGPPGPPVVSLVSAGNTTIFPAFSTSGDVGGWLYLNLDNRRMNSRASQNWVIATMFASPTYATEAPAAMLGNGCTPASKAGAQIGPAP